MLMEGVALILWVLFCYDKYKEYRSEAYAAGT